MSVILNSNVIKSFYSSSPSPSRNTWKRAAEVKAIVLRIGMSSGATQRPDATPQPVLSLWRPFTTSYNFFHDGDFLRKSDQGGFPVTRLDINSTLPQWRLLYLIVYLNRDVFGTFWCQNDPIWSYGRCCLFEKRGRSCGRVNLDVVVSVCLSYEWTICGSIREILQRNTVGSSDEIVDQLIHVSGWLFHRSISKMTCSSC